MAKGWKKGQSGNPNGRPPAPEIEALRSALAIVEKRKRKKFLIHVIEQAYDDNKLATAVLKKLVPDLKYIETTNEHELGGNTMAMVVEAIQGMKNGKGGKNER